MTQPAYMHRFHDLGQKCDLMLFAPRAEIDALRGDTWKRRHRNKLPTHWESAIEFKGIHIPLLAVRENDLSHWFAYFTNDQRTIASWFRLATGATIKFNSETDDGN